MRATGIVRRIDDLGRVIIPKEIRRTMGIQEGDPLEIFMEGQDTVCFRKYGTDLTEEIDRLREQIKAYTTLPYETQAKIDALLDIVQEMVKDEK